jgi:hypothetical protein
MKSDNDSGLTTARILKSTKQENHNQAISWTQDQAKKVTSWLNQNTPTKNPSSMTYTSSKKIFLDE